MASNRGSIHEDFQILWAHVRAMRTGVWASHADEIWDAVDRIHECVEALCRELSIDLDQLDGFLSEEKAESGL